MDVRSDLLRPEDGLNSKLDTLSKFIVSNELNERMDWTLDKYVAYGKIWQHVISPVPGSDLNFDICVPTSIRIARKSQVWLSKSISNTYWSMNSTSNTVQKCFKKSIVIFSSAEVSEMFFEKVVYFGPVQNSSLALWYGCTLLLFTKKGKTSEDPPWVPWLALPSLSIMDLKPPKRRTTILEEYEQAGK